MEVGDSTSIFAAPILGSLGIEADAHGCRQFSEGLSILSARRRAGTLPAVVVLALGANGPIANGQIAQALRIVGPARVLGLVTAPKSAVSDAKMRRAAAAHPDRVLLIDWAAFSAGHDSWFGGDGLHVGGPGAQAFSRLIRRKVAPFAFPPVEKLRLPRHSTRTTRCGTVRRNGRTSHVFIVRGRRSVLCRRARALARLPVLHPPAGWRSYDWRRTRNGPWRWVKARDDAKVVIATI
ncbi:MAG: acyltransferase 3 [Conexibacter sp.]|nr:acyltransferase 3 [Conexibacter sp.]